MHLVSYKMNKILQGIHKEKLIIYLIDNNVYVLKSLLKFKYC